MIRSSKEEELAMTYSNGRVCWDADSHLMPLPDFLSSHADAKHRDALVIDGGKNGGAGFERWFGKIVEDLEARRGDRERTQALEQNVIASAKGWAAHGAVYPEERSQTLDLLGFKGQLVFSTFCGSFIGASEPDLMYAGTRAHTRAMTGFCQDDERLLPVALIPLNDAERAIQELDFALEAGAAAVHVPSDAPGGNNTGRSPAHADLDPFWARLAEARVPMVLHIGGGKLMPKAYHNNGRPQPTDWLGGGENLRAKDWPATHHSPENFLTAMILDGLFDRHPELKCGVIELGAAWVPGFLRNLDAAFNSFRRNEPMLQALSMLPSEFVQRQVRFTPFVFEDTGWLIDQAGESLFLFSSDYPHPEGGRNPIKRFEESLDASEISEAARSRFYEHNFKDLMGIA
jgi:predicted TIM-barrel fold metal-dependent hydrolase